MKATWLDRLAMTLLAGAIAGCSPMRGGAPKASADADARQALENVRRQYAPDARMAIFNVGIQGEGRSLILTGEVDRAEARLDAVRAVQATGAVVSDHIVVLPAAALGGQTWGIACLSVASGRVQPEHKAEMGTQILMGNPVRVWKQSTNWFYVQSTDGYLTWLERGTFVRCAKDRVDSWNGAPMLIVTAMENAVLEKAEPAAEPVSDVVMGDLLKKTGEDGDWLRVELPDGRAGYLPESAAENYAAWKQSRQPTADNVERTARSFLGRPYLWGGMSPKGLDCSGLTKLAYFMNGIDLSRDAGEQAREGQEVPLDATLSQLRKGDLLFFGHRATPERPERIVHVGIYLGDKLFIHSSERVQISSLDPDSPIRDEHRIRTLVRARRILSETPSVTAHP